MYHLEWQRTLANSTARPINWQDLRQATMAASCLQCAKPQRAVQLTELITCPCLLDIVNVLTANTVLSLKDVLYCEKQTAVSLKQAPSYLPKWQCSIQSSCFMVD